MKFRSETFIWNLGDASAKLANGAPPALLTTMSMCPCRPTTSATQSATSCSSRTSTREYVGSLPSYSGSAPGVERPQTSTSAPARKNTSVMPAPTPLAPPVTSTTLLLMSRLEDMLEYYQPNARFV